MSVSNGLVDLFVVGQPKSGTTAIASYLAQHPEICMSVPKEPNYFATDHIAESDAFHGRQAFYHIRTAETYLGLFTNDATATYWGEASANYLYSTDAARNIYAHNPRATIVASLREPVAMMWSLHQQFLNETSEDEEDFLTALDKEQHRKAGSVIPRGTRCPSLLYYFERVRHAEHLARFLDHFPREQIVIVTADDLRDDSLAVCREVTARLGADSSFTPAVDPAHERKAPRFPRLNRRLHSPRLTKTVYKVLGPRLYAQTRKQVADRFLLKADTNRAIPDEVRQQLRDQLRPEVEKVSDLLERDLVAEWGY